MVDGKAKVIEFVPTFKFKVIYIFRINDDIHRGYLKIGDAQLETKETNPLSFQNNSHELNYAAKERIDEYTSTAGITYELLHTEIAVYVDSLKKSKHYGETRAFRDHNVHDVLLKSGIKRKYFDTHKKQNEWFEVDLETAKKAITAFKNCQESLNPGDLSSGQNPIEFRPEQAKAISDTISRYKVNNRMLWNAKMRFGKTLSALEVAKEEGFKKTIIITHRPVVSESWFEDFNKIFYDRKDYIFGSKNEGSSIGTLLNSGKSFVYFASMQDLRGSDIVGGHFDKNKLIFSTEWDFVVVDEAHEGTKTDLGQKVLTQVIKPETCKATKTLELSGTPFNLLTDFNKDDIYTWDYIMEQEAKTKWPLEHFGDSNPYEELPKMNIFTYHLEKSLVGYMDIEDKAFNFKEFFRTWTGDKQKDFKELPSNVSVGDFVHEDDIKSFLSLICKEDDSTRYPFSSQEYRDFFRHTLWVLPGVKEAKAFSKLLKSHPIFGQFTIVNVAGDGDEEIDSSSALDAVKNAITKNPENTRTITLSCGRLTTGVTVPEWTAVIMLAGSYSTAASQYLQTIFRVQTPANINGRTKENCYVFDFAPDRTLKMIAESVQLSATSRVSASAEYQLGQFLNFCPVIGIDESGMKEFKVSYLLQELKKAYTERVARNGFDDPKIYNDELLKLDDMQLQDFETLKKIVGATKQTKKQGDINVNDEGFSEEELEKKEKLEKKPKKELTEEEKAQLEEYKKRKTNRLTAISILRAISIRIPLMVYGIDKDINSDITVDNFADPDYIDDLSWNEFMPKGVTREIFRKFSKYYDKQMFVGACRNIRAKSKNADELEPTERVKKIAEIFATFKNPDKETVLTPWRVVNMHMSDALGGFDFYDDSNAIALDEPQFVYKGNITTSVFSKDSNILEINSKSGLYPLYVTYTIYRILLAKYLNENDNSIATFETKMSIWDSVVKNNIFVICKTTMAKLITKRTLVGYRDKKANTRYFEDLINQLKQANKLNNFLRNMHQGKSYWKVKENDNMKFNAIVGNPPYQEENDSNNRKAPVYHLFYEASFKLCDLVTLISPARFLFNAGQTPQDWNKKMLNDEHIRVVDYFENSKEVFETVDIKGGIAIILRDSKTNFGKIGTFTPNKDIARILSKTSVEPFTPLSSIVFPKSNYGLTDELYRDHPEYLNCFTDGNKNIIDASVFDKMPSVFIDTIPNSDNKILYAIVVGRQKGKRVEKFVYKKYIKSNKQFDKYKLLITGANGAGKMGETLSKPLIGTPGTCYTQTFMSIGEFDDKLEVQNCMKYVKTKFLRFLLDTLKITQNNPRETWANIPLIDFTEHSDIDWNKPISEIDQQLYMKFSLSEEEKNYIESAVKPMM